MSQDSFDDPPLDPYVRNLHDEADELRESGMLADAADAYIETAEVAKQKKLRYFYIVSLYEQAAKCLLNERDSGAFSWCQQAVDVLVENDQINQAMQFCFEYGYKFLVGCDDHYKAEILFIRGDDLRLQHGIKHSCVITKFDESDFIDDVRKAIELRDEFCQKEEYLHIIRSTHASLCENCVQAYTELDEFIEKNNKPNQNEEALEIN
ncbi:hypothetical protein RF11_15065 [Thelohanellus kitauei]|uniref:Uncharacterized protein n=1 Tax=Thelohanellus kitauei TaxID=669202 RepID=A0A0C2IEU6_THEKT|nr:hypothetical protein RF11_15065 [Thelohanellus kitauei]